MLGGRRFEIVRQRDSRHCGVACLEMMLRHFGRDYSALDIEAMCGGDIQGSSLKALTEVSANYGLKAVAAAVTPERLRELPLPCILYWDNKHFVVLYSIKGKKFRVADPGVGKITYSEAELCRHWCGTEGAGKGIALFFEDAGTEGIGPKVERADVTAGQSLGFISRYALKYRRYLFHIVLSLAVGCVLQLLAPLLMQGVVDWGIKSGAPSIVAMILLGEVVIVVGRTVTEYIRRWILLHISVRINVSLISDFLIKLFRLPVAFFEKRRFGDLVQRIADHDRIEMFLTGSLLSTLFSFVSFGVFAVALALYNVQIFLVFLAGSILQTLWTVAFMHRRKVIDYQSFSAAAANNEMVYELLTTIPEVKLQNCRRRRRGEWEEVQAELFALRMKSLALQQTQDAGGIVIRELQNVAITLIAAVAVINSQLTLGGMLAIQYIVGQLSVPVAQVLGFIYSLQDIRMSLERIMDIHGREDEVTGDKAVAPAGGDLVLAGVSFKYDIHSSKSQLDDITLTVPSGKVTAIVGASGSGKTTLIKMLLGFYKPLAGRVTVNGVDFAGMDLDSWRDRCGVVMQDGVIFAESIERNIACGDDDVDPARLDEAARAANVAEFVATLPKGYKTRIGRGGLGLSKGQKQRILIARAIYKNPDFLFLDEATNSLDTENERMIMESLDRFYAGRTVVVAAHRLSTVATADMIVVIDKGRIVERGTHASLVAAKGAYYRLVKNQLSLSE